MRISDWSSDVCSSDLERLHRGVGAGPAEGPDVARVGGIGDVDHGDAVAGDVGAVAGPGHVGVATPPTERAVPHQAQAAAVALLGPTGELVGERDVAKSEEHTSELQSLMRISYAVFCLKKKPTPTTPTYTHLTSPPQHRPATTY